MQAFGNHTGREYNDHLFSGTFFSFKYRDCLADRHIIVGRASKFIRIE
jgi:hypothetical protein